MTVDAERLVSAWLREQEEITDLVESRVYTELPRQSTFPLIRLTQSPSRQAALDRFGSLRC